MTEKGKPEMGDKISFEFKGMQMHGTYIHEDKETITIKLTSGYNISANPSEVRITNVEKLKEEKREMPGKAEAKAGTGRKSIALLATGGTIASRVDYSTGAVKPVSDIRFLTSHSKDLEEKFSLDLVVADNVLSENMTPEKWVQIAEKIKRSLDKGYGVVVSHGTDTLSYTASAMSFMFEEQTAPVIFVGSQRSPDRPSSDAYSNIEGAINFAGTNFGEVGIAMHSTMSDDKIALHRAVRSRKMHTTRRDAFKSMGFREMGYYSDGQIKMVQQYKRTSENNVLRNALDPSVALVYFHPAFSESDLEAISKGKKAIIMMGTGLGHVSDRLGGVIENMIKEGKKVLMTSQCLFGSVNLNVYSTGRSLLKKGVIPLGSMLPEIALVKAMYVLANYDNEDFEKIMLTNLRGELLSREVPVRELKGEM